MSVVSDVFSAPGPILHQATAIVLHLTADMEAVLCFVRVAGDQLGSGSGSETWSCNLSELN